MEPKEIRQAISVTVTHFSEHPEDASSEDSQAKAVLERGLRIKVLGPKSWTVTTDMPTALGGEGSAPSPGWLRRAAQAACEATMIAIRAAQAGVALDGLEVTVGSVSDDRGMLGMTEGIQAGPSESWARIVISAQGTSRNQLQEIVEWAEKHSPVTDALRRAVPHRIEIEAS